MVTWLTNNKDLIGIVLASVALAVSLCTVLLARASQRRDALMRLQEALLQPEIQEGRRLLFEFDRLGRMLDPGTSEYQMANRSLAMYDTLGLYVRRRYVSRRGALEMWHHGLCDIQVPAEHFIQVRTAMHRSGWTPWPHFRWLSAQAATYRSEEDCCAADPVGLQVGQEFMPAFARRGHGGPNGQAASDETPTEPDPAESGIEP